MEAGLDGEAELVLSDCSSVGREACVKDSIWTKMLGLLDFRLFLSRPNAAFASWRVILGW